MPGPVSRTVIIGSGDAVTVTLDRDDFDAAHDVEIRRWGKSAIALIERPTETESSGMIENTAYEA